MSVTKFGFNEATQNSGDSSVAVKRLKTDVERLETYVGTTFFNVENSVEGPQNQLSTLDNLIPDGTGLSGYDAAISELSTQLEDRPTRSEGDALVKQQSQRPRRGP